MAVKTGIRFRRPGWFPPVRGLVTDRQRSEPLRIHLAQPAWFEPRRHQREIAAGENSPRLSVIEADGDPDRIRPAAMRIDQCLLDLRLTAAGHHDLPAGLDDLVGGGQYEVDALLVNQAGDQAENRPARQRQAKLLADVIGVCLLALPIAGAKRLRQLRAGARIPAFVDAVENASQLRGVRTEPEQAFKPAAEFAGRDLLRVSRADGGKCEA